MSSLRDWPVWQLPQWLTACVTPWSRRTSPRSPGRNGTARRLRAVRRARRLRRGFRGDEAPDRGTGGPGTGCVRHLGPARRRGAARHPGAGLSSQRGLVIVARGTENLCRQRWDCVGLRFPGGLDRQADAGAHRPRDREWGRVTRLPGRGRLPAVEPPVQRKPFNDCRHALGQPGRVINRGVRRGRRVAPYLRDPRPESALRRWRVRPTGPRPADPGHSKCRNAAGRKATRMNRGGAARPRSRRRSAPASLAHSQARATRPEPVGSQ